MSTVAGVAGESGVVPGPLPGELSAPEQLVVTASGDVLTTDENALLRVHP